MKFKTKIWTLPLAAAAVFMLGMGVSWLVGARTSHSLQQLREVAQPVVVHLQRVDRGTEQFRLTLQAAASEGDIDKLKEVQLVVDKTHEVLSALAKVDGHAENAAGLKRAFDGYQTAAMGATRAMLGQGELGDQVTRMQKAQAALDELMKQRTAEAAQGAAAMEDAAVEGLKTGLWVNAITGLVVLLMLGVVSRLIVSSVWRDLGAEPAELLAVSRRIADGDLHTELAVAPDDRSLYAGLSLMQRRLCATITTIRQATDSIQTASTEIASGNHDLSLRTETTASNLQATASSMVDLTEGVRTSAESAREAAQMAGSTAQAAERGGEIVSCVVANMTDIDQASKRIAEITGVIDGIAFQTNILALNAAVEAARAGEQGRGFAVVASEVRTLAQRSAQAAREIKSLIEASSQKVESGSRLVHDAGNAMREIVAGVKNVTEVIGQISASTSAQSDGIGSVNHAVGELDRMTQQNAALVEESAAAAASMQQQALALAEAVSAFRLD
jgi:methyl-accepting chemotaxis protein